MFDWEKLHYKPNVAARFGAHSFAGLDDQNLRTATEKWLNYLLGDGGATQMWMCHDVYRCTPLREAERTLEVTLADIAAPENMLVWDSALKGEPLSRRFDLDDAPKNAWLCLEDEALLELAEAASVSVVEGLTVTLRGQMSDSDKFRRHCAFGFYRG